MADPFPLFATPAYGGFVTWQYATSMVNLADLLRWSGVNFRTEMFGGESLVDRARNACVSVFLENACCSHLFFVDSDIAFQAQDAYDMLTSGLDFVLAPYRKKREAEKWTVTLLGHGKTRAYLHRPGTGTRTIRYVECAEGGTGFLCLSRQAVERLVASVGTYAWERNGRPTRCPDLFRSVVDEDVRIGEDQYLCRRWRELGGDVWCAVDAKLGHVGTSEVFEGDYAKAIGFSLLGDHGT
jgi:hypothetical protein